ncbi:hypothetical protein DY000_02014847 [Brassica cretica]|uniref:Uncharacterized protein n=1 Tax=Brassica cretica TaxID=69181 RepID=A0ABQ7CTH6_BRACR|nr:hypothetical protein DY000_02014847 [Brassica cretica]
MRVFNAALDGSFRESRISHFKAEEAERELFWFRKEVEEQSRKQAELHSQALVRAERRGKRAIVAEMKRRAALFATKFESFKDAQEFVGDFRECRGSVATLYKSQNEGLMNGCAHSESLVPPSFGIPSRSRRTWWKREPVLVMKVPESRTERWTSLRARSGSPCPGSSTLSFEDCRDFSLSFISRFDVSRPSVAVFDLCVLWPCEAM